MSIGSNVKSRVVNWILTVVARHLDKQTQETKAIISEAQYLKASQRLSKQKTIQTPYKCRQ